MDLSYRDYEWRIQVLTNGGGAGFFNNLYTPLLAFECSKGVRGGGHAPLDNFTILGPK